MSDSSTGKTANKVPPNQGDKITWSTDLFKPLLTLAEIEGSGPAFQDESVQRRMMLVVLTKTPTELFEIGQKDPDTFTELFQIAGDYLARMETALELATAGRARLYITAERLVDEMTEGAK